MLNNGFVTADGRFVPLEPRPGGLVRAISPVFETGGVASAYLGGDFQRLIRTSAWAPVMEPSLMLGTMKVGDAVTVSFDLTLSE